jgi:hypothetical protein
MTTTSFAFLRGGAFDDARRACERAGGGYPFLLQQRSVEEERTTTTTTTFDEDDDEPDDQPEENDDVPESSFEPVDDIEATTTGGGDAGDGTLRYTRGELLALRDASVATPTGIGAEEMQSYPWRVREGENRVDKRGDVVKQATRASHSVEEMTDEEKAVAKAADEAARLATLWREDESYEVDEAEAARVLAEVDARERRKEMESLAVSGKFRVTFRDGAVRKFVNEAYAASDDDDEEESDVKTAILYGTRKRNDTAGYDVDVAFIQAWDGDLAHVLSWVAKHPREANELVGPIGWLRTNAGLGPHLPEEIKLAYEALELITDASAARLFVSLDLLISAHGDVTMECYDAQTGEGLQFVLGGDDLETAFI